MMSDSGQVWSGMSGPRQGVGYFCIAKYHQTFMSEFVITREDFPSTTMLMASENYISLNCETSGMKELTPLTCQEFQEES